MEISSPKPRSGRRPNFPSDFKRRIAERSFDPDVSVSLLARENDINANLVFKWRQAYLRGEYGMPVAYSAEKEPSETAPSLLPIHILDVPSPAESLHQPCTCHLVTQRGRLELANPTPEMLSMLVRELTRGPTI
jgi:transposase